MFRCNSFRGWIAAFMAVLMFAHLIPLTVDRVISVFSNLMIRCWALKSSPANLTLHESKKKVMGSVYILTGDTQKIVMSEKVFGHPGGV